jgi:hypothetical protein
MPLIFTTEAQMTLHHIVTHEEGENAWAAFHLMKKINPTAEMPTELIESRDWRIRHEFVKTAVQQGKVYDIKGLLNDQSIIVRRALVVGSTWLPDVERKSIMRSAIKDNSRRIRNIAAYFVREDMDVINACLQQEFQG